MRVRLFGRFRDKHSHRFGMSLAVALPVLLIGAWIALAYSKNFPGLHTLEAQARFFDILLKIATISTFALGGLWTYQAFLRQRITEARLNVTQAIQAFRLPDQRWFLKIHATLSNVGQTEVFLRLWRLHAELILPLSDSVLPDLEHEVFTDQGAHWEWFKEGEFTGESFFVRLEPGETDKVVGNIVLPEWAQVIQVFSHFSVREDGTPIPGRPSGWLCRDLVNLESVSLTSSPTAGVAPQPSWIQPTEAVRPTAAPSLIRPAEAVWPTAAPLSGLALPAIGAPAAAAPAGAAPQQDVIRPGG